MKERDHGRQPLRVDRRQRDRRNLYPGIAVAREILSRRPDARISFARTASGIEARVVPREASNRPDPQRRHQGKSMTDREGARAAGAAGDGGCVASPHGAPAASGDRRAATARAPSIVAMRGIPMPSSRTRCRRHEPAAGVAVVRGGGDVRHDAGVFDRRRSSAATRSGRSSSTRPHLERESRIDDDHSTRALVSFGSQGAHAINMAMVEAAESWRPAVRVFVPAPDGERDGGGARAYRKAGLAADVEQSGRHGTATGQADVVVCRAGDDDAGRDHGGGRRRRSRFRCRRPPTTITSAGTPRRRGVRRGGGACRRR